MPKDLTKWVLKPQIPIITNAIDTPLAQDEELISLEILQRLIAGQSKIKVWREYRGLTQSDLSKRVGIAQSMISQLESGKCVGTLALFNALVKALNLEQNDLF
ncbi:MAG: helix-turn-helix transcriptional regulator [Gammaproteobacteria bacterium]